MRIEPRVLAVRFQALEHCQRCQRGEGCGAGVFSRLFSVRPSILELPVRRDLEVGAKVLVGVSQRELLLAALLLYGLPLLAFMAAAGLAAMLLAEHRAQDLVALIGASVSAVLALLVARRWQARVLNPLLEPLSAEAERASLESEP